MFATTETICNHTFVSRPINAGSIVLDLGANHGEFSHGIIRRFGCRVIAAEPVGELCEEIDPHSLLHLLNTAVGGKNQNVELNVFSERCASVLGTVRADEALTTRTIPMVTLAEFRRLTQADRVDLLKLDIEGAEIDLLGACSDDELKEVKQITVEFHDFVYPDQRSSVFQIRDRLLDIGFWVISFSLDNSNVLFVNRATGISAAEITYLRTISKYNQGIVRRLSRSFRNIGRRVEKS